VFVQPSSPWLAQTELARQTEIIRLLSARLTRLPAHQRPIYAPSDRLAILQLKAACGWNLAQTARVFLVESETIATWLKRLNDAGPRALLQLAEPVNKFPEFVALCVRQLKATCPLFGKKRIAQMLARAGLSISTATVGRLLKRKTIGIDPTRSKVPEAKPPPAHTGRVVTARHPHHVWHTDLTLVPCISGFWIPWLPFALPQCWPFAVWVALALDHYSRTLVGFAVFRKQPTSAEVQVFLSRAIRRAGQTPKYIISDRGTQFDCASFRGWCRRKAIKPRFGAVGRYGSIAIIERFIRSLKTECTRRLGLPLSLRRIRMEIRFYAEWYREHRPHQGLAGRTPADMSGMIEQNVKEPRLSLHNRDLPPMDLVVTYLHGRRHLPIISLRKAA
jgi:transposase InsO family protein